LVLESQSSAENFQDVADEISEILNEFEVEKKFIFISGRDCNIKQLNTIGITLRKTITEKYDDWKLTDLVTESKSFLLQKEVIFQGKETQIKNIFKQSDFLTLHALHCDKIPLLLASEKRSIENLTENKQQYYTDRTTETVTNDKGVSCDFTVSVTAVLMKVSFPGFLVIVSVTSVLMIVSSLTLSLC
jgi:hypothetical protein